MTRAPSADLSILLMTGCRSCRGRSCSPAVPLVDTLAGSKADESLDRYPRSRHLLGLFQRQPDSLVGVQHKWLHAEHDFFVELAHAPVDHLLDDVRRLA